MILRFRIVIPHKLYRGGAPSPQDVHHLKTKYSIRKIVSLDQKSGQRIERVCKLLEIEHIKLYITFDRKTLLPLLTSNLKQLFLQGGPTFVHCAEGKDRTSLAVALVQCKYLGINPEHAIKEAKKLGFGIGIPLEMTHLYERLIRSCKPERDSNDADIVSNEREYIGDNRDSYLDQAHPGSFSVFLDPSKQFPIDEVYNHSYDQYPTRQNYPERPILPHSQQMNNVPNVGQFDDPELGGANIVNMTGFVNV